MTCVCVPAEESMMGSGNSAAHAPRMVVGVKVVAAADIHGGSGCENFGVWRQVRGNG
jgi:hypothetical protein